MKSTIEWRLIGGVCLTVDRQPLVIAGQRQCEVLALLLTRAGSTVSIDTIADELWGHNQPKTARNSVQRFVADLRRSLKDQAPLLETRSAGYRLNVRFEDIDIGRAASLIDEASATDDPQAARWLLSSAVGLLNGQAFDGLRVLSFVEVARVEIDESLARATEQLAALEREHGNARDAVQRLRSFIATRPFRETSTAELMRALYDLGRHNDALDAYEQLRSRLADELGLVPSPGLRELQGQILRHELQAPGSPIGTPHEAGFGLSPELASLNGEQLHAATLAEIKSHIAQAGTGHGHRVVLIGGEPGSGKTHLLARLARTAQQDGWCVLHGRCSDSGDLIYPAWSSVLTQLLAGPSTLVAADSIESLTEAIAAFAAAPSAPGGPEPKAPSLTRGEAFSRVAAAISSVAQQVPVIVVLDDLQWASGSSLDLLNSLAIQTVGSLVVLGAFRDNEEVRRHPLGSTLARPAFASRSRVVHVPSLSLEDTAALVYKSSSLPESELAPHVRAIHNRSGGNAFFAAELIRRLESDQDDGDAPGNSDQVEPLPNSIRRVVRRRVEQLGTEIVETLRAAALLGRDFDAMLLAAVLGRDPRQVVSALETVVRAQLAVESLDHIGHFRFAHDLVRENLIADLPRVEAARLHGCAADVLIAHYGTDPSYAARICRHLGATADSERSSSIVSYAHLAGSHASQRFAYAEARLWFETALEHHATGEEHDVRLLLELTVDLGREMRRMGDPEFRSKLLQAGDLAHELGADDMVVEVAKSNHLGAHSESFAYDVDRLRQLHRALEVVDPHSPDHAMLLVLLGVETTFLSPLEERMELTSQAVAIAREVADPGLLCQALTLRHTAIQVPSTLVLRLAETAEALDLASTLPDLTQQWWVHDTRARALSEAGRFDEVEVQIEAMESIGQVLGQPLMDWITNWQRAAWLLARDQLADAQRSARLARSIGLSMGEPDTQVTYAAFSAGALLQSGQISELVDPLRYQLDQANSPSLRAMLAFCLTDMGDPEAWHIVRPDIEDGFTSFDQDMSWSSSMVMCAEAVARGRLVEPCQILYDLLLPYSGLMAHSGPLFFGPIDRALGLLATVLGQPRANSYFLSAAAAMEASSSTYWLARVRLDMLDQQTWEDGDAAERLCHEVEKAAALLNNPWLLKESRLRSDPVRR